VIGSVGPEPAIYRSSEQASPVCESTKINLAATADIQIMRDKCSNTSSPKQFST
jgi:hypothetical protein